MKADPKLEIMVRAKGRDATERYLLGDDDLEPVVAVNDRPLTPEELELAAVVVALHREGATVLISAPYAGFPGEYTVALDDGMEETCTTPLAAWRAYREEVGEP